MKYTLMGLTDAEIKHELFIDEQAEALDEAINRLNEKTKPSSEEMLNSFYPCRKFTALGKTSRQKNPPK